MFSIVLVILSLASVIYARALCDAGQFWDPDTGLCKPCPPGHFQSVKGLALSCQPCKGQRHCFHPVMRIRETCTATTDNTCVCPDGTYYVSKDGQDPNDGYCKNHSKCKAGWGLKGPGTHMADTVCEPCEEGSFSSVDSSVCFPCTVCGNMDELKPCNRSSDTVCESRPSSARSKCVWSNGRVAGLSICCFVIGLSVGLIIHLCKKRRSGSRQSAVIGGNASTSRPRPTSRQNSPRRRQSAGASTVQDRDTQRDEPFDETSEIRESHM